MKITGVLSGMNSGQQTTRSTASSSRSSSKTREDARDKVSISAEAQRIVRENSAETTDRQSRLEAIKAQVASGEYSINAKEIAERVIQKEPESFLAEA